MNTLYTPLINRCEALSLNGLDPNTGEHIDVAKKSKDFLVALASGITHLAINESDSADVKAAKEKALSDLRAALDGDRAALRSLNAVRLEQVDNFIKAGTNWLRFFNVVSLGNSDEPGVKFVTGTNEVFIGYLGQHGSPMRVKIEPNQDHTRIPLNYITSRRVGYFTQDIYKGDISGLAQATLDIAFDLGFKIEKLAYTLLTTALGSGGAFGAFTFTGAKATRVYVPHSGIVTTHLPSTNDVTVYKRNGDGDFIDANGAVQSTGQVIVGKFGIPVLQEIIKYQDAWGNVFPDGRLQCTGEVIVPSSDIFDILFKLAPGVNSTSNPTESKIQGDVTTQGYTGFSYGGINWKFIPDVTIAANKCYPIFNKKPGNVYFKPGLDQEFTMTDNEKHWEERSQQKVFGAYIINQRRMNVLQLTYKS